MDFRCRICACPPPSPNITRQHQMQSCAKEPAVSPRHCNVLDRNAAPCNVVCLSACEPVRRASGKRAAQERAAQLASGAGAAAAGAAAPSERTDASGAAAGSQLVPRSHTAPKRFTRQQVPDEVLLDAALNQAIAVLPANYNFEARLQGFRSEVNIHGSRYVVCASSEVARSSALGLQGFGFESR